MAYAAAKPAAARVKSCAQFDQVLQERHGSQLFFWGTQGHRSAPMSAVGVQRADRVRWWSLRSASSVPRSLHVHDPADLSSKFPAAGLCYLLPACGFLSCLCLAGARGLLRSPPFFQSCDDCRSTSRAEFSFGLRRRFLRDGLTSYGCPSLSLRFRNCFTACFAHSTSLAASRL
jgi:hypothetical protein